MSVIPYCILLDDSVLTIPLSGIQNSTVHRLRRGKLLALYSELERGNISAATFREAALVFHRVVHAVFDQAAVVPFRFPTWLGSPELAEHLDKHSDRYTTFLTRTVSHVQMEMRLTSLSRGSPSGATSGAAYLRERGAEARRLESVAAILKKLLSSEVSEWRERDTPDGLRLYALVDRKNIAGFRDRLSERRPEAGVHLSGRWPATEFLESPRRSDG